MPPEEPFLVYIYPRLLQGVLLLVPFLAWQSRQALLIRMHSQTKQALAALTGLALVLRCFVFEPAHQVYFDEFTHLDIARNLWLHGAFAESLLNGPGAAASLSAAVWPGSYHSLLALLFSLTGFSERAAFTLNAVAGALTVPLLFVVAKELIEDDAAALFAAALLTVHPVHLRYCASTDLAATSLFWICAAFVCVRAHLRRPGLATRILFLAVLTCAVHARLENFLYAGLLGVYLRAKDRKLLPAHRFAMADAAFLLGLLPIALIAAGNFSVKLPGFDATLSQTSVRFLGHALANGAYLLDPRGGLLVAVLFAVGAAAAWRSRRKEAAFGLAWLCVFAGFYSCYYRGDFRLEENDRYGLVLLPPLLALAGVGARRLARRARAPAGAALPALVALFVVSSWGAYRRPSSPHEAEIAALRRSDRGAAASAYVVAFSPPVVIVATGRPSVSPYLILDGAPEWNGIADSQKATLLIYKDFWWRQLAPDAARLEKALSADYDSTSAGAFTVLKRRN